MNEVTVSMSIERYKQLESAETALQMLHKTDSRYFLYKPYHGMYLISDSEHAAIVMAKEAKDAIEARDHIIQKVREFENRTGKTVF